MTDKVDLVMKIYPHLDKFCCKTQLAIERSALRTSGDTFRLVRSVENLIELKLSFINLGVMVREILAELDDEERFAVLASAHGDTYASIAEHFDISLSTAARLVMRGKRRFERMMYRYDWEKINSLASRVKLVD